jgi:hypothetical protein
LRLLISSTILDAARKLGVSEETIDGILDCWIEREVDWTAWEWLGVIGIDEIALKRGHRDFVALVTAPLEGGGVEILAVLAARKKETVAAFLRAIPEQLRRTTERACTDMYEGFVRAIEEEVPWAEIVIDGFMWRGLTATAPMRCASRKSSGSSERCPQPSMPSFRGQCGRFASGLRISSRRSGTCSSESSPPCRRSRQLTTYGQT